jgi:hypothetical protein
VRRVDQVKTHLTYQTHQTHQAYTTCATYGGWPCERT